MGNGESRDRSVPERRRFVRWLDAREEIRGVDFTRDGFRTVFVEVSPDADEAWRRSAERLGYTVEPPGAETHRQWRVDEWWPGAPGSVRVLRQDAARAPPPL